MASTSEVEEPFPIFKLAHRYLLYDINTITHVRAKHNMCGVLIGGLPQAPQQNVFLGIPLELMPEEARLLCEKGAAYVVDDVKAHKQGFLDRVSGLGEEERKAYSDSLRKQGVAAAGQTGKKMEERKKAGLTKKFGTDDWNDIPEEMLRPTSRAAGKTGKKKARRQPGEAGSEGPSGSTTPANLSRPETPAQRNGEAAGNSEETAAEGEQVDEEEMLFASPMNSFPAREKGLSGILRPSNGSLPPFGTSRFAITPTTSYPPLTATPPATRNATPELPDVPPSYPLFKHLHSKNYFMSPGLRFGCQYTAYPGDPLRFHSHFLCNGMEWDREFDLMDLVGGGRLGTGVKKGFLVGGQERKDIGGQSEGSGEGGNEGDGGRVRAFCIEWAGM